MPKSQRAFAMFQEYYNAGNAGFLDLAEAQEEILRLKLEMLDIQQDRALGLYLTGEYLSVPASVGFIALFGIAVQNGLVLVSYINQLREEGHGTSEAIVEASLLRLRPVLMTALTTILGLVPLLVSHGMGSEVQRPLAVVVVFGLISSTFLTLVLIPTLYQWFASKFDEGCTSIGTREREIPRFKLMRVKKIVAIKQYYYCGN